MPAPVPSRTGAVVLGPDTSGIGEHHGGDSAVPASSKDRTARAIIGGAAARGAPYAAISSVAPLPSSARTARTLGTSRSTTRADRAQLSAEPVLYDAKSAFQSPYPFSRVIQRSVPVYSTTSPRLDMA